jgi:hypothetical protein
MEEYSMTALFNISEAWTDYWSVVLPVNSYLIVAPSSRPPGFDLGHHEWVLLNRFRMHRWGYVDSLVFDCGADQCIDGAMWTRLSLTVGLINKQCLTS